MDEYDSAKFYYNKSLEYAGEDSSRLTDGIIWNLARIKIAEKKFSESIIDLNSCLDFFQNVQQDTLEVIFVL
mgnify:FL=1